MMIPSLIKLVIQQAVYLLLDLVHDQLQLCCLASLPGCASQLSSHSSLSGTRPVSHSVSQSITHNEITLGWFWVRPSHVGFLVNCRVGGCLSDVWMII